MKIWASIISSFAVVTIAMTGLLITEKFRNNILHLSNSSKIIHKSAIKDLTLPSEKYKLESKYCTIEKEEELDEWIRDEEGNLIQEDHTIIDNEERFYNFSYGYITYRLGQYTQTKVTNFLLSPCSILRIYSIYNEYASSLKSDKKIVEYYYKILSIISFAAVNLNGSEEKMKIAMAASRIVTHFREVNVNSPQSTLIDAGEKTLNTYYSSYKRNAEGFKDKIFSHYAILQAWKFSQNLEVSAKQHLHMYKIFDLLRDNSFFSQLILQSKNAKSAVKLAYKQVTSHVTNDFYEISTQ